MEDLKVKHFCKGVTFAVILAVLWFFYSKASTFGTILRETESKADILLRSNINGKVHADAYRQTISSRVRSRGLQWFQEHDNQSRHQGTLLYSGSLGDSSDDPDTDADVSGISPSILRNK